MIKERISVYFSDKSASGWSKKHCDRLIDAHIKNIENHFWINAVPYMSEHTHCLIRWDNIYINHESKSITLTPLDQNKLGRLIQQKYQSYSVRITVDIYFEYESSLNYIKLKHPKIYELMCCQNPARNGELSNFYNHMLSSLLSNSYSLSMNI